MRDLVRVGLLKTMAAEVEMLCGPKDRPHEDGEFRRAGSESGHAFVNGGKESIRRPRVRSVDGAEMALETYRQASKPGRTPSRRSSRRWQRACRCVASRSATAARSNALKPARCGSKRAGLNWSGCESAAWNWSREMGSEKSRMERF